MAFWILFVSSQIQSLQSHMSIQCRFTSVHINEFSVYVAWFQGGYASVPQLLQVCVPRCLLCAQFWQYCLRPVVLPLASLSSLSAQPLQVNQPHFLSATDA
eukprot:779091-Amphidinium_carterae.1